MKMKDWIVPIVFLILPFAFLSPGLIWKSQLLFFLICPIFIIALNIKNLWVRAFLLYVTFWQIAVLILMFNRAGYNPGAGLSIILSLMVGAMFYKWVSESDLEEETWHAVIRAAVIIQMIIAIPQAWGWSPVSELLGMFTTVKEKSPGHLVGTLGNRNYLAAFIAMAVPFFIGWRTFRIWRVTVNPALIVIFAFLGACFSPGTLAAIMGMGFLMTYNLPLWKRIIGLSAASKVAVIFAAFYIFSTGNHLNEFQAFAGQFKELWSTGKVTLDPFQGDIGRFAMWMTAYSKLTASWNVMILGYGPAAFWGREYPMHSQYMSVWFQFGLIGLGLMLGYIYSAYRYLSRSGNLILLTALVIAALDMIANFTGEIVSTAFMLVIIGGLIERKRLTEGGIK
jgi:hypothetical protein